MKRSITVPNLALMVFWVLCVPARAGSLSGTFDGTSTITPTGTPGIYSGMFTGDGDDVTYGSFTPSSTSTIDFSNPPNIVISNVMFSLDFTQGTLNGTGSGSGNGNGHGMATFTLDITITGGTEFFAGATGSITLMGDLTQTSPTTLTVSNGTYLGTFSIPEPSTLTLLTPPLAVGAVVLVRRRRTRGVAR
jgi:hypothetical protein